MKKQVRVYYTGKVQGVGFRFTVQDIAADLGVTGLVRNLRDGQVEVVAEAEEDRLTDFLRQVKSRFSRYIQDADIRWQPAGGEFRGFSISF